MLNINEITGTHDILLITFDTLRCDAAISCAEENRTPFLNRLLGPRGWEARHSPGSFTYAAHHAFFAGFFPTPLPPGKHPRPFALSFPGSETITRETRVFDTGDIVSGLAGHGYHTICIGGVGFFNKQSPLGAVLPGLFHESHWSPELGVTSPRSTENQVRLATTLLKEIPRDRRVFLFVNISAIHQPNCIFSPGKSEDTLETHEAALAYVDGQLPPLFDAMRERASVFCILCSDHGTAYGEDGHQGNRVGHEVVYTVPYAEIVLPERSRGNKNDPA
ncbi:MAG: metalloenzyme domain-containing protein [Desulfobacterales bacterium]|nr:metalloenzyme domain-containing protein [Desulfobacterales bacterium]